MAGVGSVEVARDPEVRVPWAANKRLAQALDIWPPAGLVGHSDPGSQYTATRFKTLLARHGAVPSKSRRGNCYDNAHAHAESLWSRFKAELYGSNSPGLAEARLEISHHVACYNDERRHSAPGYQSPNHFETQFKPTSQLCPA